MVPSLLAHAVFRGSHPHGIWEVGATIVGVAEAVVLLGAVVLLLRPTELGFSLNVRLTYVELWEQQIREQQILEQPMLHLVLADALQDRREPNRAAVDRLARYLTISLIALVVEAAGFATAAAPAS